MTLGMGVLLTGFARLFRAGLIGCLCTASLAWAADSERVIPPGPGRILIVAQDGTGQYRSIQEAIDAAASGDTVKIKAGDYHEDVTVHSKDRLRVIGEGADRVSLFGRRRFGVFHIGKWPYGATRVEVSGMTIHEHGGLSLGIFNAENLVLRDLKIKGMLFGQQVKGVRIEGCTIGGSETTGVQFADSNATLVGNVIHDNDHGVTVAGQSTVYLERNVITRNLFEGVVVKDSARSRLVRNTLVKNGGGAAFLDRSTSEVSGNIVGFNKVGFLIGESSHVTISFNAMYNSQADYLRTGDQGGPAPELKPSSDLSVDPLFVNVSEGDFRLRPETPLTHVGGFAYLGALAPAKIVP